MNTVRDVLEHAAERVMETEHLGKRPAKAYVHNMGWAEFLALVAPSVRRSTPSN